VAISANAVLGARLKQASRIKSRLQEDLVAMKREREKVALRMDEVRRTHMNAMEANRDLDALNADYHDIDLAIDRGRAFSRDEPGKDGPLDLAGLEILLKGLSGEVCAEGTNGGMLNRIKSFNSLLEKVAARI